MPDGVLIGSLPHAIARGAADLGAKRTGGTKQGGMSGQERVAQSLSRVMLNTHLALARLHLHHLVLRNRLRVNCRINLVPSMARK